MAIIRTFASTHQEMVDWLQENTVPSLFKSLTFVDNKLTGYDSSDKEIFKWALGNGGTGQGTGSGTINMYRVPDDPSTVVSVGNIPSYSGQTSAPIYLFKCDAGVFITQHYTASGYQYILNVIMTKNNHGQFAVVMNASQDGSNYSWNTRFRPVAIGDRTGSVNQFSFSTSSQFQTQFVPFITYAQTDQVSYTPCAYYLPAGEYYGIERGIFTSESGTYVTNGYIALKDAEVPVDIES